jgi:hypothetical protein
LSEDGRNISTSLFGGNKILSIVVLYVCYALLDRIMTSPQSTYWVRVAVSDTLGRSHGHSVAS